MQSISTFTSDPVKAVAESVHTLGFVMENNLTWKNTSFVPFEQLQLPSDDGMLIFLLSISIVTLVIPSAVLDTTVFPSPDPHPTGGGTHDPTMLPDGFFMEIVVVKDPCIVHTREKSVVVMIEFFDAKDNPDIAEKVLLPMQTNNSKLCILDTQVLLISVF